METKTNGRDIELLKWNVEENNQKTKTITKPSNCKIEGRKDVKGIIGKERKGIDAFLERTNCCDNKKTMESQTTQKNAQ